MKQNPFSEKRKKREEGRQAPEPSRNQEEPANHEGTKAVFSKNWEPHSAQELFGEIFKKKYWISMRNFTIPNICSTAMGAKASVGLRCDTPAVSMNEMAPVQPPTNSSSASWESISGSSWDHWPDHLHEGCDQQVQFLLSRGPKTKTFYARHTQKQSWEQISAVKTKRYQISKHASTLVVGKRWSVRHVLCEVSCNFRSFHPAVQFPAFRNVLSL